MLTDQIVITCMRPNLLIEKEETVGPLVCMSKYTDINEQENEEKSDNFMTNGPLVVSFYRGVWDLIAI